MRTMKRFCWEISEDRRRASLWDEGKAMLTKYSFRKSRRLAGVCGACAFAVERTVCDIKPEDLERSKQLANAVSEE